MSCRIQVCTYNLSFWKADSDIFASGPNCLVSKMSYTEKYMSYFVSPLAISAALILPSLYVMTYGLLFHGKIHAHPKFEDTITLFLQSLLFFSLAIYPTISSISLAVFDCDNQLGLLKADYSQRCLGNGWNGELTWWVPSIQPEHISVDCWKD
jgi:hypothetical protein